MSTEDNSRLLVHHQGLETRNDNTMEHIHNEVRSDQRLLIIVLKSREESLWALFRELPIDNSQRMRLTAKL